MNISTALNNNTFVASSEAEIEAYLDHAAEEFHVASGTDLTDRAIHLLSREDFAIATSVKRTPILSNVPESGVVMWDAPSQSGLAGFAWRVTTEQGRQFLTVDALGSGYEMVRNVVAAMAARPHMLMTIPVASNADNSHDALDRSANRLRALVSPILAWIADPSVPQPKPLSKAAAKKAAQRERRNKR